MRMGRGFLAVLMALASFACFGKCADQLPFGQAPQYTRPSMMENTQFVCFDEFVVFFSGKTKTPLWVSELLTPQRVQGAQRVKRQGEFHEETALGDKGSRLEDYRYSGYDRGHMAPSADMSTVESQQQSFSLANIVPQNHQQNSGAWLDVEKKVRTLAQKEAVYVITGVLFEGESLLFLRGRVAVPSFMYKVVYVPRTNEAGVYMVPNTKNASVAILSLEELEQRGHVQFLLPHPSTLALSSP